MKKYLFMMQVLVIIGYILPVYAASDNEISAADGNKYDMLKSAFDEVNNKSKLLTILDEISKAGIWDEVKLVYHEMNEFSGKRLGRNCGNGRSYDGRSKPVWEGSRGGLFYKGNYIEAQMAKTNNSAERQHTLELIERVGAGSIDQALLTMMGEAEEHGSHMQEYIEEQLGQIEQAKQDIQQGLSRYSVEVVASGSRCRLVIRKKLEEDPVSDEWSADDQKALRAEEPVRYLKEQSSCEALVRYVKRSERIKEQKKRAKNGQNRVSQKGRNKRLGSNKIEKKPRDY